MVVVGLLVCGVFREREPEYGGWTLSQWVASYEQPVVRTRGRGFAKHNTDADLAVQHIGANAIPFLVKWMGYETPSWQVKCFARVNPILRRVRPSWQLTDIREQSRAVRAIPALAALGPKAAIPEIARMLNDPKASTTKERAVMALGYLGKDGISAEVDPV